MKGDPRAGRPRTPEDIKALSAYTREQVAAAMARFLGLSLEQLEVILKDKSLTLIEHWVANIAKVGIKNGDALRLEYLLTKIFGAQATNTDRAKIIDLIPTDKLLELVENK